MHTSSRPFADSEFSEVVARERPLMVATVRRQLNGSPDAEDIVQTALLRAWERRGQANESLGGWAWSILLQELALRRRNARKAAEIISLPGHAA